MREEALVIEQPGREAAAKNGTEERLARVAVLGATGYAGRELISLLMRHGGVRIARLMSSGKSRSGPAPVADSHAVLRGVTQVPIEPLALEPLTAAAVDFVFLATPHEASHDLVPVLLGRGLKVVDLSGAFRLKDPGAYPRWYGFEHQARTALAEAVYGIPELNAAEIRKSLLVANPGCYPTSVILALAPLLRSGLIDKEAGIVCDAKSGATGAGRSLRDDLLFASVAENCRPYGAFGHRHVPEMLQELDLASESFTFTPHLLPLTRGILSTIYFRLTRVLDADELSKVCQEFFSQAPLVRVYPAGKLPEIQSVAHTQFADLGFAVDASTRRAIAVSAIDNLGKGAAGQAVQNMNLMLGYREDQGLK
ncbi:MAG: N-acetyl-gamma-glutamyl-phosphate reductase [Acidobacteriota bacterium]|nr:N-acetyl-gamma-glutamyl-phosphate reductase [Acidobacteriota bacterium]